MRLSVRDIKARIYELAASWMLSDAIGQRFCIDKHARHMTLIMARVRIMGNLHVFPYV